MTLKRRLLLLLLALAVAPAVAQETGVAVRQSEVKKEPFSDAATVGTLPAKTQVKIVKREGGWMQIESAAAAGWVRMLEIRLGATGGGGEQASGDAGVKSMFNLARTGSSGTAVATGVRGLSKEQIQNARPNPVELEKLSAFAAARPDAEQFAAGDPQLKPQTIEYMSAPGAGAKK
jgi:hypothetical protein